MSQSSRFLPGHPTAAAFADAHPPVARVLHSVLAGPGVTTPELRSAAAMEGAVPVGERELFAAFVSKKNQCAY